MSADKKTVAEQMERLSGLNYWPIDNRTALKEIAAQLALARTDEIVIKIVSDWIAYYPDAPKPSDVHKLINAENLRVLSEQEKRTAMCPVCNGIGFEIVTRSDGRGGTVSGARGCICRGGELGLAAQGIASTLP